MNDKIKNGLHWLGFFLWDCAWEVLVRVGAGIIARYLVLTTTGNVNLAEIAGVVVLFTMRLRAPVLSGTIAKKELLLVKLSLESLVEDHENAGCKDCVIVAGGKRAIEIVTEALEG